MAKSIGITGVVGRAVLCCAVVAVAATGAAGCDKNGGAGASASDSGGSSAAANPEPAAGAVDSGAGAAVVAADSGAAAAAVVAADSGAGAGAGAGTGGPVVLTVRVINGGDHAINMFMNDDVNELLHVFREGPQRGSTEDDERVKLFPVGRMALCSEAQGAGYGGIGQPGRRMVQPGEALEYGWDGQQRAEVNQPGRGVCQQVSAPQPGRYRLEFDQPYDAPRCNKPTFDWPLAADAPHTIEIRCVGRAVTHHG